jgi:hypothetical protein
MELVKTTPQLAHQILQNGNRKIVIGNGKKVEWINLNNKTLFAGFKLNGSTHNLEDFELFISVPDNAKTVY